MRVKISSSGRGRGEPAAVWTYTHAMKSVLIVDDAPEFRELLVALFERNSFEVRSTEDGETAVELARSRPPDVIVLDVGLGGIDGVEVCRRIRTFSDSYVIMLTARDEEVDRLIGLSVGADDYVTKPFFPRELMARVNALMRRPHSSSPAPDEAGRVRRFGRLELDPQARSVSLDGIELDLTRIEYDLLDALSENPRLTLSRQQLLDRVWGPSWFGDDHVVDVHVSNLRRKLDDDPRKPHFIRTVRGFGYRLGDGMTAGVGT
jgi:DNA-binding response OmpR family regulator